MTTATQIEAPQAEVTALELAWPYVLPGLEALQAQGDHDWSVASVRKLVEEERAFLVLDGRDPYSFAVLMLDYYPYERDAMELFVLIGYDKAGDAIEHFMDRLEHVARELGAKYVRFYSKRAGMTKVMPARGYRVRSVEYVKELRHG